MSGEWLRLDPRVVPALAVMVLGPLVPTALLMLIAGADPGTLGLTGGIWLAVAVLVLGARTLEWYVSSYRITAERVELRSGFLARNHRSLPRDRIRSVDLTADVLHRLLGLAVVRIGTGAQGEGELRLDAVARAEAERIRAGLLRRPSTSDARSEPGAADDGALARLHPAWLLYSAVTLSLVLAVWGAMASAFGSFSDVVEKFGFYQAAGRLFNSVPRWLAIGAPAVALLVIGVLGSFLLSLELWWGFTLTREDTGTLRVRRGLLTRRSISLEEQRLRGVELVEPLLLRWAGGARTNAVATGLSEDSSGKNQPAAKTLLPPAPRAEALRVAAAVLREPLLKPEFPAGDLRPHPRAALHRRIRWGLFGAAPFAAAAAVAAALGWCPVWAAVVVAVAAAGIGLAAGFDAHRNLGHRLHDRYLLARRGTGLRRTVALQRSGIIGWRIEQSVFQRRADLVDVVATTAAGQGRYAVPDVTTAAGLEFAEEAVPGLLAPFLEPAPAEKRD